MKFAGVVKKKILHLNECFVQYNLLLKGDGSLTIREQKWDRTTQEINKHSWNVYLVSHIAKLWGYKEEWDLRELTIQ